MAIIWLVVLFLRIRSLRNLNQLVKLVKIYSFLWHLLKGERSFKRKAKWSFLISNDSQNKISHHWPIFADLYFYQKTKLYFIPISCINCWFHFGFVHKWKLNSTRCLGMLSDKISDSHSQNMFFFLFKKTPLNRWTSWIMGNWVDVFTSWCVSWLFRFKKGKKTKWHHGFLGKGDKTVNAMSKM